MLVSVQFVNPIRKALSKFCTSNFGIKKRMDGIDQMLPYFGFGVTGMFLVDPHPKRPETKRSKN